MTSSATLRNGLTLDYVEQGNPSGRAVVFLHGATDSWRSFEPVLPHLPSSMRAIAVSQRGHGDSERPDHGYRIADLSKDLEMFLDALDIRRAIIVGHSMGSYVAQRFAMDHPRRTAGLVLMGSFASMRGNHVLADLWNTSLTLNDPIDRSFIVDFQESTLARPVPPSWLETVVEESAKVPARVWKATFAEFVVADFSGELPKITAPTLVVWGEQDSVVPRADQDALVAAIPNARLRIYEGAGHGFHWEDPARFASHLVSFITEL
jgi:pimeloyl-ACP methyl ester carboxylesterase